jgi:hypothetical protein
MSRRFIRAAIIAVAAIIPLVAGMVPASADASGKAFCHDKGNAAGGCLQWIGANVTPGVTPYDSSAPGAFSVTRTGLTGGCNNNRVSTGGADGCWWPFTTHAFDTDYHGDIVVGLQFTAHGQCIITVPHTISGAGDTWVKADDGSCDNGILWVRDGSYGYVSVKGSDADGAHRYLYSKSCFSCGGDVAALGAWQADYAQWDFCGTTC